MPRSQKIPKLSEHLKIAVQLKPDSAAARTNLAANLPRAGKFDLAAKQFRKALALEPEISRRTTIWVSYYIQSGKIAEAIPLLEKAQQIDPTSYDNGYDLAHGLLAHWPAQPRRGSLSRTLIDRKTPVNCKICWARSKRKTESSWPRQTNIETAAHMDPSEDNLFDWGSELLHPPNLRARHRGLPAGNTALSEVAATLDRARNGALFARQI